MKTLNKLFTITLLIATTVTVANAQQGFGTSTPAPSSVIDMVSGNKGALLPRISLTSTNVAAPVSAPANSLTVFNTNTAGDVTPGYYYWSTSASKWVRLLDNLSAVAIEPWNVQNTSTKSILNGDNIYQQGKVAVGFLPSDAVSAKQFDVKGDLKAKYLSGGNYYGIETGDAGLGIPTSLMYVSNNTNISAATQTSISILRPGIANFQSSYGTGGGSIAAFSSATGGNVSMIANNSDGTITTSVWGHNDGTLSNLALSHAKQSAESSNLTIEKLKGITLSFNNAAGTVTGNYTFPRVNGTANQVLVTDGGAVGVGAQLSWKDIPSDITVDNGLTRTLNNIQLGGSLTKATTITTDATKTLALAGLQNGLSSDKIVSVDATSGIIKTLRAALPSFFYAPSVVIPTHDVNGIPLTGNQTIDIYGKYAQQFGFTGGIGQARSNASSTLPVLLATDLDYFITYFDNTVFNTVTISASGVITYTVKSTAVPTEASFMNIVFKVK